MARAKVKLDRIDAKILDLLQRDGSLSIHDIAEDVGLSNTPVWKRIKRYEESGLLKRRVALLDPELLGFNLTGFVLIKAPEHSKEWTSNLVRVIEVIPNIVEAYRLNGEIDYLLKIVAKDMYDYDKIYKYLLEKVSFKDVNSVFCMEIMVENMVFPIY